MNRIKSVAENRLRPSYVLIRNSKHLRHSKRRRITPTVYNKTGNLRAVQLLLGHKKMDSTLRYLGVDIKDALSLSEGIDLQLPHRPACCVSVGPKPLFAFVLMLRLA